MPNNNEILLREAIINNNISKYYSDLGDVNKELTYKRKSYQQTLKMTESEKGSKTDKNIMLAFIEAQFGNIKESAKEYDSAIYHYNKSLVRFNQYGNKLTLYGKISALKGLSNVHMETKQYEKAIDFAETALNYQLKEIQPSLRKDLYQILEKSHLELNQTDSAKKYLSLYSKLNDSITNVNTKKQSLAVNNIIAEEERQYEKNFNRTINYAIAITCGIIIIGLIISSIINKRQRKKYLLIIEKIQQSQDIENETNQNYKILENSSSNPISYQTANHIITQLQKFERSKQFLSININLPSLANDFGTNTKYLSQIINDYKKKSFNNYINSLRIEYICQELFKNTTIRKYKISSLAEMSGFSSREVFTTTFKKETGMTPTQYIKNLNTP